MYVVAGHGGKLALPPTGHPITYFDEGALGSCLLEVDGHTLTVSNLRSDGVVSDMFSIVKAPPEFVRGDCNVNDRLDSGDPVCAILCSIGPAPATSDCRYAADCNCVAGLEASDPVCTALRLIDGFDDDQCLASAGGDLIGQRVTAANSGATTALRVRVQQPKEGRVRGRITISLRRSADEDIASAYALLEGEQAIRRVRLARRLRRRGFRIFAATERGSTDAKFFIMPPVLGAVIPSMGAGRVAVVGVADGGGSLTIRHADFGNRVGALVPAGG